MDLESKRKTLEELEALRAGWAAAGRRVVWTNGCFDLIHAGHVRSLRDAKALGDVLIVGINSDRSVRAIKGSGRPLIPESDRAELLAALESVDYVTVFDENDPTAALATLRPDVHCKGAEYADGSRPVPEREIVLGYGGEVRFLPFHPGLSTTALIAKSGLLRLVESASRVNILVAGDVMLDEYVYGEATRISPEAPVPVVAVSGRRYQPGGAANVAANIRSMGARVTLAGVVGVDAAGLRLGRELEGTGIGNALVEDRTRTTTLKTRITAGDQQIVRFDEEDTGPLPEAISEELRRVCSEALLSADGCVISDYAKGVVDESLCQWLIAEAVKAGKPVIVDPKSRDFARYRGATAITPNLKETAAAAGAPAHDPATLELAIPKLLESIGPSALLVTKGGDGMSLFEQGKGAWHVPATAVEVADVTGAGDTVAAILAIALALGFPLRDAAGFANIAAGLAVRHPGTWAVQPAELLRAV